MGYLAAAKAAFGVLLLSSSPAWSREPKPVKQAEPVYYDFKGARLGMPVAQWKALEPPAAPAVYVSKYDGPLIVWCSNSVHPDGKPVSETFFLNPVEKSLGIVACSYGRMSRIVGTSFFSPASIKIGQFAASNVEYKFLNGLLYQIDITGHKNLLSDVMDGLTAKFGPPTTEINDTTQNKAGASFPHTVQTWINPVATIRVETPWTRIDNLNVSYSLNAAMEQIVAAEKAANPADQKM